MWHIVVVVSLVHYLLPVYTAAVSMHGGWYPITLGPGVMPLTMMGTVLACEIPCTTPGGYSGLDAAWCLYADDALSMSTMVDWILHRIARGILDAMHLG